MQRSQTITRLSLFPKREGYIAYDVRSVNGRLRKLHSAAISNTKCRKLKPSYAIDVGGIRGSLFELKE